MRAVGLPAARRAARGPHHPAVYRVEFACGCGELHPALVSHDELDWAPLGLAAQTQLREPHDRAPRPARRRALRPRRAAASRRGQWPWSFFCWPEERPRQVFPSAFLLLPRRARDERVVVAVRCPACGELSVNLVTRAHRRPSLPQRQRRSACSRRGSAASHGRPAIRSIAPRRSSRRAGSGRKECVWKETNPPARDGSAPAPADQRLRDPPRDTTPATHVAGAPGLAPAAPRTSRLSAGADRAAGAAERPRTARRSARLRVRSRAARRRRRRSRTTRVVLSVDPHEEEDRSPRDRGDHERVRRRKAGGDASDEDEEGESDGPKKRRHPVREGRHGRSLDQFPWALVLPGSG